jgi:2-dehydro-3-deoxyphosphogluconate aldolase/(4S)-4-hydroxy-2-oxoglutarate aldolase
MSATSLESQWGSLGQQLWRGGLIAVLVIDEPSHAPGVARALLDGGVRAMELTLRTPRAIEAVREVRRYVPDMLAGIGTVLTPEQLDQACDAGAQFAVAPGLNRRVVERARQRQIPFAPGIATPTELEQALELGCRLVKWFPAEPLGGLNYLQSLVAPYAHCGVKFIPLGGITLDNLAPYLQYESVWAAGGSWLATRPMIQAEQWADITQRASQAMELVRAVRPERLPCE